MTRIVIFGANGMLGSVLARSLSGEYDVRAVGGRPQSVTVDLKDYLGLDVSNSVTWRLFLDSVEPDFIINCAGVVKQRSGSVESFIRVNSLFPNLLDSYCREHQVRLIHFSTDCVFSGRQGGYRESDIADPVDLYGKSKLLGELTASSALTIRTSFFGLENESKYGLIEWFLGQRNCQVQGYTDAIYSGLLTNDVGEFVAGLIREKSGLSGLWHLSSEPISKYDLLQMIASRCPELRIEVIPFRGPKIDRSLDSTRLRQRMLVPEKKWDDVVEELVDQIRRREFCG